MKLRTKKTSWRRCWHQHVPRRARILICDEHENVRLVDSRKESFAQDWFERTGARIKLYFLIDPLPYETLPLPFPNLDVAA